MDAEPAEICESRIAVARKDHRCCECLGEIKKGDKYEVSSGIADGEWFRYKTCLPCSRIRKHETDFCAPFKALRVWIKEVHDFDYLEGA